MSEEPTALRLADALDMHWIEHSRCHPNDSPMCEAAAAELRRLHAENEALRAQIGQGEPVAFMSSKQLPALKDPEDEGGKYMPLRKTKLGNFDLPLYTHPAPQQKPLTDEQIEAIYTQETGSLIDDSPWALVDFVRAIEAAHGIK